LVEGLLVGQEVLALAAGHYLVAEPQLAEEARSASDRRRVDYLLAEGLLAGQEVLASAAGRHPAAEAELG
jgi:hypothetical protein